MYGFDLEGSKATKACGRGAANREPDKNQDLRLDDWYDPIDSLACLTKHWCFFRSLIQRRIERTT